jgi:hypothetical protein
MGRTNACQVLPDLPITTAALTMSPLHHRVVMVLPALAAAPLEVRDEAELRFEEIAGALDEIRPDNAFWASMRVSRLCLVVRGWSFFYELDDEDLRVIAAYRGRRPG